MENKDKLIDRVRKIINKAENTDNEHEALIFMQKAQELMAKYQIYQFELDNVKTEEIISEKYRHNSKALWVWGLAITCGLAYQVQVLRGRTYATFDGNGNEMDKNNNNWSLEHKYKSFSNFIFCGKSSNVSATIMMFQSAYIFSKKLANKKAKEFKKLYGYRDIDVLISFRAGFISGLRNSILSQENKIVEDYPKYQKYALATINEVDNFINNIKTKKTNCDINVKNLHAYQAGISQGKGFARDIETNVTPTKKLLNYN